MGGVARGRRHAGAAGEQQRREERREDAGDAHGADLLGGDVGEASGAPAPSVPSTSSRRRGSLGAGEPPGEVLSANDVVTAGGPPMTARLQTAPSLARLGTESAFEVLARAQKLAAEGRDVINLGIGQPDFPTPEHIVEAAVKALRDGAHGYTPANGVPPLREAVAADLHRRHGAEVDPDHVVVVPGGKPTMFFAVLMFGEPGAEIMHPNPGFPIYESVIDFTGATPVPIELREASGFAFDADSVLAKVTERTRLIILNSPANP